MLIQKNMEMDSLYGLTAALIMENFQKIILKGMGLIFGMIKKIHWRMEK